MEDFYIHIKLYASTLIYIYDSFIVKYTIIYNTMYCYIVAIDASCVSG